MALGVLTLWVPDRWAASMFQIGVFLLAAVAVVRCRRRPPRFVWPLIPLSAAVLWGVIQWTTGLTVYGFDTVTATVQWTTLLATFLLGLELFRDPAARRWFRSFAVWFGFGIAVIATLQTFTSGGRVFWVFPTAYTDFVMGPILNRNHYAAFMELVLPVALYLSFRSERGRLLYSGVAAAMYASVAASASRAGTVLVTAEAIAVPVLLWMQGRLAGRVARVSLARIAVLLMLFCAIVGPGTIAHRFQVQDPYSGRREFAIASLHMIADHPVAGTGLGTWPTEYPRYATIDLAAFVNQAHSDWLQWSAEGGVPLGIMLLTLFVWSIRPAARSVWGIGVVAVFLHAVVDYPFARPALAAWTILFLSLLACEGHQIGERISGGGELMRGDAPVSGRDGGCGAGRAEVEERSDLP